MRPEWLDSMSWEMAEVYGAITDQIMINLAKYFPYYNSVSDVPRSAFTYQAAMLAQMGQVNKETARIIRNGLKDADDALKGILEQAIIDSVKKADKPLWKAVEKGIFMPPQTPVVSPNQYRAFQLYYSQAAEKLNLVNTVMLESTQQAYQSTVSDIVNRVQVTQTALDIGAGETITGVSSWNEAVRHSINRMKDGGITGFIDHAGRQWSAEAYTAMDIRTTVYNTSRAAVWETNQNFGNDLYLVSYHNGARPLCYPWQNKVISSMDSARVVTDLDGNEIQVIAQSDTSYGEPAGLFGINCKHYPSPFIPGVSIIRGEPQSPEENAKSYAESQEQRRLERKIREEKRDLMMLKAQGAPDEEIKAQRAKIRQTDDDIDAFCEQTGRTRRQNREGVYTKREFPAANTYDAREFTAEQKNRIDRYYRNGGEQQAFAGAFADKQISNGTTNNGNLQPDGITGQAKQIEQFNALSTRMNDQYGITVNDDVKALDFDSVNATIDGFDAIAKDFPGIENHISSMGTISDGIMAYNAERLGFNPEYFAQTPESKELLAKTISENVQSGWWVKNASLGSMGAHESAHAVERLLIETSGKYNSKLKKVFAWNNSTEAINIVNEAVNNVLNSPYGKGKTAIDLISEISNQAVTLGSSEKMADAFADYYANKQNASVLSKEIYNVSLNTYRKYVSGGGS